MPAISYIYINALLYVVTFLCDILKNKRFSKTSLIWLLFSLNAVFAIPFFSVSIEPYNNITLLPFLFLYLCIFISVYPYSLLEIRGIKVPNPVFLKFIIYTLAIVSFTPFIENAVHIQDVFGNSSAIADIYETKMDDNADKASLINWYDPISRYFNSVCLQLQELSPILLFYYLTLPKVKKWIVVGLILSILNPMLYSIALAGRGNAAITILYLCFIYLVFRKLIPAKRLRLFRWIGIGAGSMFIGLFAFLSIARFDAQTNSYDMISWLSLYFGESMLNFNDRMWNAPYLMNGDYSFSFFKDCLGLDTVGGIMDSRDYWGPKLGFSIGRFFTFVGDILGDFGWFGTLVFIGIISFLIYYNVKKQRNYNFAKLILILCWAKVLVGGFATYNFGTKSASQRLVEIIIICLILGRPFIKKTRIRTISVNKS